MRLHPGIVTCPDIVAICMGSQRDDWQFVVIDACLSDFPRGAQTVENRHSDIHQDQVEIFKSALRGQHALHTFPAVAGQFVVNACIFQYSGDQSLIDVIVFDDQHAACLYLGSRRLGELSILCRRWPLAREKRQFQQERRSFRKPAPRAQ